jgi:hypothetical protein
MKSNLISFCLTVLFACSTAFAQVSYTYNSTQAGQMSVEAVPNYATITDLTVTGNIDARDIKFMRDSMIVLAELDLSGAAVVAYSGSDGTSSDNKTYPDNEMPEYSFCDPSNNQGKTSLVSVQFPAGLTSIGEMAFFGCGGLTGFLTLPSGLTFIGDGAFSNCRGLTGSLTFPADLTSIGNSAFSNCRGLTGSLTFPTNLTYIGDYAFYACGGLTGSLTFPAGMTSIGASTFYDCGGLNGSLTFPAGLTSIETFAFSGCSGLTGSLTFPAGLTSIGEWAFQFCRGFTGSLILPSGLASIGMSAFHSCSGFTDSLILPFGLTSISGFAFNNCEGFTNIINFNPEPASITYNVFSVDRHTCTLTVPACALSAYENAEIWKDFSTIIAIVHFHVLRA